MGTIKFRGTEDAVRDVSGFVTQQGTLDIQFDGPDFVLDCDELLRKAGVGSDHPAFGLVFGSILPAHVYAARGAAKAIRHARSYAASPETAQQVVLANPIPPALRAAFQTAERIAAGERVVILYGAPGIGKSTVFHLLRQTYMDRAQRDTESYPIEAVPPEVAELFPLAPGVRGAAGQQRLARIWTRATEGVWKPGTVVLMDEAEMNLSITWQGSLVGALLILAGKYELHFVLATNSPYIIGEHTELALRVGDPA